MRVARWMSTMQLSVGGSPVWLLAPTPGFRVVPVQALWCRKGSWRLNWDTSHNFIAPRGGGSQK